MGRDHALAGPIERELAPVPERQRAAVAGALGLVARGGGADRFLVSAGCCRCCLGPPTAARCCA